MTPPSREPSSEELAHAAQGGTVAAFEALVARFEGPLFRFLRLRARGPADAEELAQATLVRAWSNIHRYDVERPFATWLFTIARHLAVSHHRTLVRRTGPPVPVDLASTDPGPHEALSSREEGDNLWRLAARVLNPDQRSALWLRYVEDLPPTEIGRVLGKRGPAVRVLLFRARRTLARHLPAPPRACRNGRDVPDAPTAALDATPLARSSS